MPKSEPSLFRIQFDRWFLKEPIVLPLDQRLFRMDTHLDRTPQSGGLGISLFYNQEWGVGVDFFCMAKAYISGSIDFIAWTFFIDFIEIIPQFTVYNKKGALYLRLAILMRFVYKLLNHLRTACRRKIGRIAQVCTNLMM